MKSTIFRVTPKLHSLFIPFSSYGFEDERGSSLQSPKCHALSGQLQCQKQAGPEISETYNSIHNPLILMKHVLFTWATVNKLKNSWGFIL